MKKYCYAIKAEKLYPAIAVIIINEDDENIENWHKTGEDNYDNIRN